jgi:peptidoglycan/xylan/chitin deacetylase (PgdA/CDA1 family)
MMNKAQTWIGTATVALGVASVGVAIDRLLGTRRFAAAATCGAAGAYLVGTFSPRARIFGQSAKPGPTAGLFALTFDDGPDPRHTLEISRMLSERGHQATFFVLARAVRAHPMTAASVVGDGHELACHGDNHRLLAFSSPREIRRQISVAEDAVAEATGSSLTPLFRAPHGVRSPWLARVVRKAGYQMCAWDGAVFDTDEPGTEVVVRRVEGQLRPGAIVLLHDGDGSGGMASRQQTVDALPAILDAAECQGLRSVGLRVLLDSKHVRRQVEQVGFPAVDLPAAYRPGKVNDGISALGT